MKPDRTRFLSGALFLFTSVAHAQNIGQPASEPPHPDKVILTECEGGDNCGTWTFLWANGKGYGKWRTGEEAVLEMKATAEGKVVILRSDVTGAKEGLTATYEGTLSNRQLGGTFKHTYKGETVPGFWNAVVEAPASTGPTVPTLMHFCASSCVTLVWDRDHFTAQGAEGNSVWTVEFKDGSVVMHRTDYRPYPGTAVLKGQLSNDGNSVVNGTITWTSHSGLPGVGVPVPFKAAWGAALKTVAGCDAERDGTGTCQQMQSASQIGNNGNGIVVELAKEAAHGVAHGAGEEFGRELMQFLKSLSQQ